ncbi:hypothetical protein PHLCEN_2v10515 [Hermanssonia centrifuga]|uniref:Uncharacterized protein n=1 Tax=Hermanssonia centrifuga TaxID=98765 RepID=A0A2R6NNH6_9APHY|nr:hypothetical protein PHLCEN_2v10515 [Hermanssonia centrifuga]
MAKRKAAQKPPSPESKAPLVDISEQDQWKIINDSGILHKIQDGSGVQESAAETTDKEEPLLSPLTEEIFRALSLIIPHASLLILFEMYVFVCLI